MYRIGNDGTQRRCCVCNRATRQGFFIKKLEAGDPPVGGFYCSQRCFEDAQDSVAKIQAGATSAVVLKEKMAGR